MGAKSRPCRKQDAAGPAKNKASDEGKAWGSEAKRPSGRMSAKASFRGLSEHRRVLDKAEVAYHLRDFDDLLAARGL